MECSKSDMEPSKRAARTSSPFLLSCLCLCQTISTMVVSLCAAMVLVEPCFMRQFGRDMCVLLAARSDERQRFLAAATFVTPRCLQIATQSAPQLRQHIQIDNVGAKRRQGPLRAHWRKHDHRMHGPRELLGHSARHARATPDLASAPPLVRLRVCRHKVSVRAPRVVCSRSTERLLRQPTRRRGSNRRARVPAPIAKIGR